MRSWEAEDVRPVQSERQAREKHADAEVEEAQARGALPGHTTKQHPGRRSWTASTQRARENERMCTQGRCQGTECQQQFRLGRGCRRNFDLRSTRIQVINCTSSVGADTTHKEARVAAKATCAHHRVNLEAVCSSARATFLLQGGVSAGLSARRLDPRRRQAKLTLAAGLD